MRRESQQLASATQLISESGVGWRGPELYLCVSLQVFMLDTQCSPKTPNNFDHAQSCQLIIELPPDEKPNGHTKKR